MVGNRNNLLGGWDAVGYNNSGDENFLPQEMDGWQAFITGKPKFKMTPQELAYTP